MNLIKQGNRATIVKHHVRMFVTRNFLDISTLKVRDETILGKFSLDITFEGNNNVPVE